MLTFSDPLTGFILLDTQVHVSLGWLLRPKEFRRQCRHTVQKPQFDSWAIYAQLPDSIVQLLESALMPRGTRVSILSSSAGAMYAVVAPNSPACSCAACSASRTTTRRTG